MTLQNERQQMTIVITIVKLTYITHLYILGIKMVLKNKNVAL